MTSQQEAIMAVIAKRRGDTVDEVEEEEVVEQEEEEVADDDGEEAATEPEEASVEEPEEGTEEAAEEEEETEAEEPVEDGFFIARYKSREEAERGLAEKDATIQRLYDERNQQLQYQQPEPEGPVQIDVEQWIEWAGEEIQRRDPREVFAEAVSHGGEDAGFLVIDAMYATGEPSMMREATTLATDYRMAYAQAVESQQRAPEIQRQQQAEVQRQAVQARAAMVNAYPDYEQVEAEMNSLVDSLDSQTRVILEEVSKAGEEGKRFVLWTLYNAARSETPERLVEAKVTQLRKADERSRSKKIAASVASATASPERTPLTEAERDDLAVKNRIRKGAGLPLLDEGDE